MLTFDENWERWCKVSLIKHFESGKGDSHVFVEGFPRSTDNKSDYFEVRVDGPYIRENANDQWRYLFEVNLLVVVKIDPTKDAYRINRLTGRAAALFTETIDVYKYGNTTPDDMSLVGSLVLVPRANERIQISHFGKIRPDTDILQASVEGHYHIFFD